MDLHSQLIFFKKFYIMSSSQIQQLQRKLKSQGSQKSDRRRPNSKTADKDISDLSSGTSTVPDDENARGKKNRLFINARNAHNLEEKNFFINKKKNDKKNLSKESRHKLPGSSHKERESQRESLPETFNTFKEYEAKHIKIYETYNLLREMEIYDDIDLVNNKISVTKVHHLGRYIKIDEVLRSGHQAEHGDLRQNDKKRSRRNKNKSLINKDVNLNSNGYLTAKNTVQPINKNYRATIQSSEYTRFPVW